MGTWRSPRDEKLHRRFVVAVSSTRPGRADDRGALSPPRSPASASPRATRPRSPDRLRVVVLLFYPAQFLAGLINAQPMGFYPVEVLVNDAKRHGVAVLPVDINASAYLTTTEWVGVDPEPLPPDVGIDRRPEVVRSPACVVPTPAARGRWAAESATGWGVRLGLGLVKGIGEEHADRLDGELASGPYRSLADVVERTGLPEEVLERLVRAGGLDTLGRPRRALLWQLPRSWARAAGGSMGGRRRPPHEPRNGPPAGRSICACRRPRRQNCRRSVRSSVWRRLRGDLARRQEPGHRVVPGRAREARGGPGLGLSEHRPGRVRSAAGGHRQHPMTARGAVFHPSRMRQGIPNVTLWPDALGELRGIVRRPPSCSWTDAPARGQRGQRHHHTRSGRCRKRPRCRRPRAAAGRAPARLGQDASDRLTVVARPTCRPARSTGTSRQPSAPAVSGGLSPWSCLSTASAAASARCSG